MADDKSKVGKSDRDRINIDEGYEVEHWSKKFGVSHQELIEAVQIVGPMTKDVEAHLSGRKHNV